MVIPLTALRVNRVLLDHFPSLKALRVCVLPAIPSMALCVSRVVIPLMALRANRVLPI